MHPRRRGGEEEEGKSRADGDVVSHVTNRGLVRGFGRGGGVSRGGDGEDERGAEEGERRKMMRPRRRTKKRGAKM